MRQIVIPPGAAAVLRTLEQAGHRAYVVGGCCRDALLGRTPNDWDVCTSALPEQVLALFPDCIPTGLKHGTVTVRAAGELIEVTTFRVDGEYHDHRRPDRVQFSGSLTEDLARRDFTMNAMAADLRGCLTDPFGGAGDIRRGLIRCVGDPEQRFGEDALRMFRAVRFAAQLNFELDSQLAAAARQLAPTARFVAAERIYTETVKALLSPAPDRLALAFEWGLYGDVSPCTPDLNVLASLPPDAGIRLTALAAALLQCGAISSAGGFLRSLRAPAAQIKTAQDVLDPSPVWTGRTLPQVAAAVGRENALCAAGAMEVMGLRGSIGRMRALLAENRCLSVAELDITGRDLLTLGYSGRQVGACLHQLLEYVLAHPEDNQKALLLRLAQEKQP